MKLTEPQLTKRDVTNGQSEPPTVLEILQRYLKEHGHAGLCNSDAECGCSINDLIPCCNVGTTCQPAKRSVNEFGEAIFVPDKKPPTPTFVCNRCHQLGLRTKSVLQNGQELCKECAE